MDKKILGSRIKYLRALYNQRTGQELTQEILAAKIGVSRSYIGDIENGRCYPGIEVLSDIAKACNVSLSFFGDGAIEGDEIPLDLKNLGVEYLSVAKELKERGLSPDEIRRIADFVATIKKTD